MPKPAWYCIGATVGIVCLLYMTGAMDMTPSHLKSDPRLVSSSLNGGSPPTVEALHAERKRLSAIKKKVMHAQRLLLANL